MKTLSRGTVINELRDYLMGFTSRRHSMCEIAGRLGIFCRGFKRLTDEELNEKYDWIRRIRRNMTRAQLEELVNRYTLNRQEALDLPFACDAMAIDRDTCLGWDSFSNGELARFYKEWFAEEIAIDDAEQAG